MADDIVIDYTAGLKPLRWPQDRLSPPTQYGYQLYPIDRINENNVRREFYNLSGSVSNIARGEARTVTLPVDVSGDFYWTQIMSLVFLTGTATGSSGYGGMMSVSDMQSGYQYFRPGIQFENTRSNIARGEVLMPNFVVRGGGLRCDFWSDAKAGARVGYDLYFTFIGWKEYDNVAT